jgi:hypothetical protein
MLHLTDAEWRQLLSIARQTLGRGSWPSWKSESWCAWTTFSSLESHLTYWARGLPEEHELLEKCTADGGTWTQPFAYSDIAHLIIPAKFYWEKVSEGSFENGIKTQDIPKLAENLSQAGLPYRLTDLVLEIKLY